VCVCVCVLACLWRSFLVGGSCYLIRIRASATYTHAHARRAFAQSLFPGGVTFGMPPHGEMTKLLRDSGFATLPPRIEGTLLDAANAAKRELKFLLIVLHSPGDPESDRFLRYIHVP
jgi:hypothetical protein